MTRDEADAAFDCLTRHARAITPPTDPAEALALVDRSALAQLQRDAIIHYISVGPAVVNLAYRVLKAATATFVAARFAGDAGGEQRELFVARMLPVDPVPGAATAADLSRGLVERLRDRLASGRDLLAPGDGEPAAGDGAGDLLEAAGIAYVLAQLLENPPQPVPARA